MNSKAVLALSLILLSGSVIGHSANSHSNHGVEPEPGLIGSGSIFYILDVTYDDLFSSNEDAVFERASEMAVAGKNGNVEALNKAKSQLNKTVSEMEANNNTEGLSKARNLLDNVRGETDGRSNIGIGDAIENIESVEAN